MNFLKNNLSKMLITSIFLLFFLIAISSVNAVNITLNPSDSGGINSAISDINSHTDTNNILTLNPGTYNKTTDRNNEITFNNKNLIIQGNGPKNSIIIDAQKMGRMFTITGNINITFINISFINGNKNDGGTIHNTQSKITINNCTFTNNTAINRIAIANAGAIYNTGNLTVIGCNFTNNTVESNSISAAYGGAIFNNGILTVMSCNFTNNTAENVAYVGGGAIYNYKGTCTVTGCNFINNIVTSPSNAATATSGAIFNAGNLTVTSCNFTNNTVKLPNNYAAYGGAIYNEPNSIITVTGCNFINNTIIASSTGFGGAIYSGSNCTITGCNIINNSNGIYIGLYSGNANINYNRIFNNTNYDLNNAATGNINADFNWWGSNSPNMSKIMGITLANYFIMYVVNLTPLDSNGTVIFNSSFKLNDTGVFDIGKLPFFETYVETNLTTGIIGYFNALQPFSIIINNVGAIKYIFTTDNEVQSLLGTIKLESNSTNPIVPGKTSPSLSLFLDRQYGYGYLVGEVATVSWVTSGIANLNQRAMIQFIEDGKVWHTQYVLLSDGKYLHKFIMSHKSLDVVMIFLGDIDSYGSSDKVPTYVDPVNDRRTFVEIQNMSNLTVGKKGYIDIIVKDYKGEIIKTGKVTLKFDNKWSFTVNIKNGLAKFSKIFTKSGNNRTLKITYIKDGNNTASSITNKIVVNKKLN